MGFLDFLRPAMSENQVAADLAHATFETGQLLGQRLPLGLQSIGYAAPPVEAQNDKQPILLGFAYNMIDRTAYPILTPTQQQTLMDAYSSQFERALLRSSRSRISSAAAHAYFDLVSSYHAALGNLEFDFAPRPGTVFWDTGKLIAEALGHPADIAAITVVCTELGIAAKALKTVTEQRVARLRRS